MEYSSLSNLIDVVERGTRLHICIAFLDHFGNRKTRCHESQTIHDQPICLAFKKQPNGIASCYRCRMTVQQAITKRKTSMAGFCTNGVYEYCRPVVYEGRAICAIFIGNILTKDPHQREMLEEKVGSKLLKTMEQDITQEDCEKIANLIESYILFLFQRYGNEDQTFDPLIENIRNHIRENIAMDLSLEELAAAFHYSPKYLGRLFKARTGQTVRGYCNHMKLRYAQSLLNDTELSIEAVATQAGFGSINYFDRIFRKMTGVSPGEYRNSSKKK